jgi:hypothetical protein
VFNLVKVAITAIFQISSTRLCSVVTVKVFVSGLFETEDAEQEANEIDDDENNEGIVVQVRFNDGPEGIFNKVNEPVGTVTESRASSKSMKWQEFSGHANWNNDQYMILSRLKI